MFTRFHLPRCGLPRWAFGLVAGLLAVAAVAGLVVALQQAGAADDARAETGKVEKDLAGTKDDLKTTESDLTIANDTIADYALTEEACDTLVDPDLQFETMQALIGATEDALYQNYGTGKLDQATRNTDDMKVLMEGAGYPYIQDLWAACDSGYGVTG